MDKLYKKCRNLVRENIPYCNGEVLNILTLSVLSLMLTLGEENIKNLFNKLRTLHIYSDNRSVIDVAHKELDNYENDDDLKFAVAALIREVYYKNNKPYEIRSLIIPRKNINNNPIEVVEATTHELVHLLRYGDTYVSSGCILTNDGIASKKINCSTGEVFHKNRILEESIVQKYAKDSTNALLEYLSSVQTFNGTINKMKKNKDSYESLIYDIPVHLLERFLDDSSFKGLVDATFISRSPKDLSRYFNMVMEDDYSFTKLSDAFDLIFFCIQNNDTMGIKRLIGIIMDNAKAYYKNNKVYEKN